MSDLVDIDEIEGLYARLGRYGIHSDSSMEEIDAASFAVMREKGVGDGANDLAAIRKLIRIDVRLAVDFLSCCGPRLPSDWDADRGLRGNRGNDPMMISSMADLQRRLSQLCSSLGQQSARDEVGVLLHGARQLADFGRFWHELDQPSIELLTAIAPYHPDHPQEVFDWLRLGGVKCMRLARHHENSEQLERAVYAWRMAIGFLVAALIDGGQLRNWARETREPVFGRPIDPACCDGIRISVERLFRLHFEAIASSIAPHTNAHLIYRRLPDEFARELLFVRKTQRVGLEMGHDRELKIRGGPFMLRMCGSDDLFVRAAVEHSENRRESSDVNRALRRLADLFDVRLPSLNRAGDPSIDWCEWMTPFGVVRTLMEHDQWGRAMGCLEELEAVAPSVLLPGLPDLPGSECYNPTEFNKRLEGLKIECLEALATAELTRRSRDFDVIANYWSRALDSAERLGERDSTLNRLIQTCLGVANGYRKRNRLTSAIQFLCDCDATLDDSRIRAQLQSIRNQLAVEYAENEDFEAGYALARKNVQMAEPSSMCILNYVNIGTAWIRRLIGDDPNHASTVAKEIVSQTRQIGSRNSGTIDLSVLRTLINLFYQEGMKRIEFDPVSALEILILGERMGFQRVVFWVGFDTVLDHILETKSVRSAERMGILDDVSSHLDKQPKLETIIVNARVGVSKDVIDELSEAEVLESLDELSETGETGELDETDTMLMRRLFLRSLQLEILPRALRMVANKCASIPDSSELFAVCRATYAASLMARMIGSRGDHGVDLMKDVGELLRRKR